MFLLDTNVFIEAHKRYYNIEICPYFWTWLKTTANRTCYSINMVKNEICKGEDWLSNFIKHDMSKNFFINQDIASLDTIAIVADAIKDYNQTVQKTFSESADFFLLAVAYQQKHIIVTQEAMAFNISAKRIKIPNIANKLNIECINTFEMLKMIKKWEDSAK